MEMILIGCTLLVIAAMLWCMLGLAKIMVITSKMDWDGVDTKSLVFIYGLMTIGIILIGGSAVNG